jgi:hypothetical protein
MFVEIKVHYSALFTNLVRWHASPVSFTLSDIILAQLACSLSVIIICLHSGITNLSLYWHWYVPPSWLRMLVLSVGGAKIWSVKVGTSIDLPRLPWWPTCLVLVWQFVPAVLKWFFFKLICLEQSIFLRYLWGKPKKNTKEN